MLPLPLMLCLRGHGEGAKVVVGCALFQASISPTCCCYICCKYCLFTTYNMLMPPTDELLITVKSTLDCYYTFYYLLHTNMPIYTYTHIHRLFSLWGGKCFGKKHEWSSKWNKYELWVRIHMGLYYMHIYIYTHVCTRIISSFVCLLSCQAFYCSVSYYLICCGKKFPIAFDCFCYEPCVIYLHMYIHAYMYMSIRILLNY